jgi:predicted phage-related endonuclease
MLGITSKRKITTKKGGVMSVEIGKGVVDFDENIAMWLEQYRHALIKIKEWEEVADVARSHIEASLGDNEVGLYKGREVVRFTTVTSMRFDTKRAKEILPPQVLDVLQVQSTHRRFTLVSQEAE